MPSFKSNIPSSVWIVEDSACLLLVWRRQNFPCGNPFSARCWSELLWGLRKAVHGRAPGLCAAPQHSRLEIAQLGPESHNFGFHQNSPFSLILQYLRRRYDWVSGTAWEIHSILFHRCGLPGRYWCLPAKVLLFQFRLPTRTEHEFMQTKGSNKWGSKNGNFWSHEFQYLSIFCLYYLHISF